MVYVASRCLARTGAPSIPNSSEGCAHLPKPAELLHLDRMLLVQVARTSLSLMLLLQERLSRSALAGPLHSCRTKPRSSRCSEVPPGLFHPPPAPRSSAATGTPARRAAPPRRTPALGRPQPPPGMSHSSRLCFATLASHLSFSLPCVASNSHGELNAAPG